MKKLALLAVLLGLMPLAQGMSEEDMIQAALQESLEEAQRVKALEQASNIEKGLEQSSQAYAQEQNLRKQREEQQAQAEAVRQLEHQNFILRQAQIERDIRTQPRSPQAGPSRLTTQESEEESFRQALIQSQQAFASEQGRILEPGKTYKRLILSAPHSGEHAYKSTSLQVYKVYQLALTHPQSAENISCGPRDLFIADAIDILRKRGKPIGAKNIARILKSDKPNSHYQKSLAACVSAGQQLYTDEFEKFIFSYGLDIEKYYVLGRNINPNTGQALILSYDPFLNHNELTLQLQLLGEQLKRNEIKYPIHFICNDASKGHWFLISIIKNQETRPIVYYIDSKNVDVTEYPVAHNFIIYLFETLGLPADNGNEK